MRGVRRIAEDVRRIGADCVAQSRAPDVVVEEERLRSVRRASGVALGDERVKVVHPEEQRPRRRQHVDVDVSRMRRAAVLNERDAVRHDLVGTELRAPPLGKVEAAEAERRARVAPRRAGVLAEKV